MQLRQTEAERLDGWKEIAAFLGRSVRTVQVWEALHNLPVHRQLKRVWAVPSELSSWLETHQDLALPPEPSAPLAPDPTPPPPISPLHSSRLLALSAFLMAALFLIYFYFTRPGIPVDYATRNSVLTVTDSAGKTVFVHTFPEPLHEEIRSGPSALPKLRGQFVRFGSPSDPHFLYRQWPRDLARQNSSLHCFAANGRLRWSFSPGRPALKLADGRIITGTYTVQHVAFLPHPRPDGGRIVVSSHHSWDWPNQIAILTPDGKLVDEYWHPGWIFSLDTADLNQDGKDEILLGGVNNAFLAANGHGATLVLLSAESIRGQGRTPVSSRLRIDSLPPGPELRVLLFPEFAPHPNPNHYAHIERILALPDRSIQLVLTQGFGPALFEEPYSHLQLDSHLNVTRVLPGARLAEILAPRLTGPSTPSALADLYRKSIATVLEPPAQHTPRASR